MFRPNIGQEIRRIVREDRRLSTNIDIGTEQKSHQNIYAPPTYASLLIFPITR